MTNEGRKLFNADFWRKTMSINPKEHVAIAGRTPRLRRVISCLGAGLAAVVIEYYSSARLGAEPVKTTVTLKGESSGGVLTLMRAPGGNYPYVAVTNRPGDSASVVADRLAIQLAECSGCRRWTGGGYHAGNGVLVLASGFLDYRECSPWIFGGTDTGFNIPSPLLSVSASYTSNMVTVKWVNPTGGYDSIGIVYGGVPWSVLPGSLTRYVHNRDTGDPRISVYPSSDVTYVVVGYKDGAPSNGAGVRLRNHVLQESLMNMPFTRGIAPSFSAWTHNTSAESLRFYQGNLPGMAPGRGVESFAGKGFYQVLKGQGTFTGGVSRRFLGLIPGHSYQLGARLNTLESKQGNWTFSFHAAYNPASGEDLTAAQMAGDEALPNGTKGKTAGQIARYDSTVTTEGKWLVRFSGKKDSDNATGDITLPAQASNSITIWFRLEGKDAADVSVGLDSVTIEDLGENPKN